MYLDIYKSLHLSNSFENTQYFSLELELSMQNQLHKGDSEGEIEVDEIEGVDNNKCLDRIVVPHSKLMK